MKLLGAVGFQNWYINLLSKNQELQATYAGICCYTVESAQCEIAQSHTSVRAIKDGVADHVGNIFLGRQVLSIDSSPFKTTF